MGPSFNKQVDSVEFIHKQNRFLVVKKIYNMPFSGEYFISETDQQQNIFIRLTEICEQCFSNYNNISTSSIDTERAELTEAEHS